MIIGVVTYYGTGKSSNNKVFARIKPVAEMNNSLVTSLAEVARKAKYPHEGMIYWWGPPAEAREGTIWSAEIEKLEKPSGSDHFVVKNDTAVLLTELIEPFVRTDHDLRRELANGRLTIGRSPASKFMIAHPAMDHSWIGPFEVLEVIGGQDVRTVSVKVPTTGFAAVCQIEEGARLELVFSGANRCVLLPNKSLEQVAQFCTQSDDKVLASLLVRIRKLDSDAADSLKVVRATFEQYCTTLAHADLGVHDRQRDEERRRVCKSLLEDIALDRGDGLSIMDWLLQNPRVQAEIERRIDAVARATVSAITQTQDAEIALRVQRLEALAAEIAEREEALALIKGDEEQLRSQVQSLLVDAKARARLLIESYARSVEAGPVHGDGGQPSPPKRELFQAKDELKNAVTKQSWGAGFSEGSLQLAIAGLAASSLVAVIGSRQDQLVRLIGSLVNPFGACEVHASTDVFGLKDLLRNPALRMLRGQHGAQSLGEFLTHQQQLGEISIVSIRGANLLPPESIWPELRRLSMPGALVGWTDHRGSIHQLELVTPTLFLLSLVDGDSAFRITDVASRAIPVVDADSGFDGLDELAAGMPANERLVSTSLWLSIREAIGVADGQDNPSDLALARGMVLLGADERDARHMAKIATRLGRDGGLAESLESSGAGAEFVAMARGRNAEVMTSLYRGKSDE